MGDRLEPGGRPATDRRARVARNAEASEACGPGGSRRQKHGSRNRGDRLLATPGSGKPRDGDSVEVKRSD